MDDRAIEELYALDALDRELSAQAERLHDLQSAVAEIRARAESIDAFFAAYPAAEQRIRGLAGTAESDLATRRGELAAAEAERDRAHDAEARSAAEKAVTRARDHLEVAKSRVERVAAERDALERDAAGLPSELPVLAERSADVARELDCEAPADAPTALVDWAARAQASLFVAAGQIDAQRERVIREANELATMLLGEPTYGATPAQARARVEAALR